jgi:hypothetical protein
MSDGDGGMDGGMDGWMPGWSAAVAVYIQLHVIAGWADWTSAYAVPWQMQTHRRRAGAHLAQSSSRHGEQHPGMIGACRWHFAAGVVCALRHGVRMLARFAGG